MSRFIDLSVTVDENTFSPPSTNMKLEITPHVNDSDSVRLEIDTTMSQEARDLEIGATMEAYEQTLAGSFDGRDPDITEENLQARIRGNLLMALSNKFGWLVLTTGNKSELSVGYSTLYGDTAGGFAVIKDVPKTLVYRLARHRNAAAEAAGEPPPIPQTILDRAPSAELRPDQRDEDSLPPYPVLDPILEAYVSSSGRGVAHGDRHARERAQPLVVVEEVDLPHPGGSPAVPGPRDGVDRPAGDRSHEAGLVGEAHGHGGALGVDGEEGGGRAHVLGDRRVHAAVDQSGGLEQLGTDLHLGAHLVLLERRDLDAHELGEPLGEGLGWDRGHGGAL